MATPSDQRPIPKSPETLAMNACNASVKRGSGPRMNQAAKVSADKIKIADNEEMQNAWSIKFKANENAKVFDAKEKQVGAVKFGADTGKIKIKDAADKDVYVVESGKRSNSYGALLLKDVPEEYRRILLGELFVRGL